MKILVVLVIVSLTSYAAACSCGSRTEADKISDADFHVLVRVTDNGNVNGNLKVYEVDVIDTYKSEVNKNPLIRGRLNDQYIFTQASSAACGANLQQGLCYNLTGTYKMALVTYRQQSWPFRRQLCIERRMYTTLCDLRRPLGGRLPPSLPEPPFPPSLPEPPFPPRLPEPPFFPTRLPIPPFFPTRLPIPPFFPPRLPPRLPIPPFFPPRLPTPSPRLTIPTYYPRRTTTIARTMGENERQSYP